MTDLERVLDEDLSALLDAELSPEREAELLARIESEPALAKRLAEFEAVSTELRALPAVEPSRELRDHVRQRIEFSDSVQPARSRRQLKAWIGIAAVAASVSVYLLVGVNPVAAPQPGPVPVASQLEAATDEELAIVLEYETLADFELIEELDVLELLAERG